MSIKRIFAKIVAQIFCVFPIKSNKIVFSSFHGKYYNDAPKNISDVLLDDKNLEIVWILPKGAIIPKGIRTVTPYSLAELFELETAKVWVDNSRKYLWMKKRKGQYYIQTWHGSVGIKKAEADTEKTLSANYIKRAKYDSSMVDLFICDNEWQYQKYKNGFLWSNGDIVKCAVRQLKKTREEIENIINNVKSKYRIPKTSRIMLYAPTFRSDENLGPYNLSYNDILKVLENRFGGDWRILVRLHPNLFNYQKDIKYNDRVLDGSIVQELDDLVHASDIVVSDYSSVLFFGMRLDKITFIYAEDWKDYERGFEFNIKSLPAPFADSNISMLKNIIEFDEKQYKNNLDRFLKQINFYDEPGPEYLAQLIKNIAINN